MILCLLCIKFSGFNRKLTKLFVAILSDKIKGLLVVGWPVGTVFSRFQSLED